MQDEIVTHLARSMQLQLTEAEGARLKRTPAANPNAEDLALQCVAGLSKGGYIGKEAEADAAYALCERALAIDPNNVRALRRRPRCAAGSSASVGEAYFALQWYDGYGADSVLSRGGPSRRALRPLATSPDGRQGRILA